MMNENNIVKKHLKLSKIGIKICLCFFIILFLISCYKIVNWYLDNMETKKVIKEINPSDNVTEEKQIIVDDEGKEEEVSLYSLNFDELKKMNNNVKGWLVVGGTNINYPLVQTKDNSYYLNHSFNKSYNSAGWPFIDYRNALDDNDKNIIAYAHNRKNGDMFGTLGYVLKNSWLNDKSKQYINFTTETKHYVYEVFSVYETDVESYYILTTFSDNNTYLEFLNTIINRSIHNFNISLNENDKIITLSTCSEGNKGRIVLHAKLIYEQ